MGTNPCVSVVAAAAKEEQGALPSALCQHMCLIPEDSHVHYQQNIKSIPGCDFACSLGTAMVEEIAPLGLAVPLAARTTNSHNHQGGEDQSLCRAQTCGDTGGSVCVAECSAQSFPTSGRAQHSQVVQLREQPHLKRGWLSQLGAGEVSVCSRACLCLCLLAFPALLSHRTQHSLCQLLHLPVLSRYS